MATHADSAVKFVAASGRRGLLRIVRLLSLFEEGDDGVIGVVLALVGDVAGDLVEVARADGDGAVTRLPFER